MGDSGGAQLSEPEEVDRQPGGCWESGCRGAWGPAGQGAAPRGLCSSAGGSTGLLMDLAANEKAVHADFFNGEDTGGVFLLFPSDFLGWCSYRFINPYRGLNRK
uniref:COP9 signalosome complex subunit 9 n=1 Tax=Capra hircus TaxID=9925 RepID=A0A8C2NJ10_CAPHI